MAQFKQATAVSGETIALNMDRIDYMEQYDGFTIVHFTSDDDLQIKETMDDLMMKNTLRNM